MAALDSLVLQSASDAAAQAALLKALLACLQTGEGAGEEDQHVAIHATNLSGEWMRRLVEAGWLYPELLEALLHNALKPRVERLVTLCCDEIMTNASLNAPHSTQKLPADLQELLHDVTQGAERREDLSPLVEISRGWFGIIVSSVAVDSLQGLVEPALQKRLHPPAPENEAFDWRSREGGLWLFHAVAVCHCCPEWMLEPRKDGVPVCISVTLDALTHSRFRVRKAAETLVPTLIYTLGHDEHMLALMGGLVDVMFQTTTSRHAHERAMSARLEAQLRHTSQASTMTQGNKPTVAVRVITTCSRWLARVACSHASEPSDVDALLLSRVFGVICDWARLTESDELDRSLGLLVATMGQVVERLQAAVAGASHMGAGLRCVEHLSIALCDVVHRHNEEGSFQDLAPVRRAVCACDELWALGRIQPEHGMFEFLGLLEHSLRFGLVPEVAAVAVRWLDYVIRGFKEPCLLLSPSGLDKTSSAHLLLRSLIEECSADVLRPRLPLLMESIIELLERTAQVPLTNNYHLVSLFGTIDLLAQSPLGGENLQPWVGRLSRLLVDHVQRGQATPNTDKDCVQALWCCVQLAAGSIDCAGEVDRRVVRLLAHADWAVVHAGRENDYHRFELSAQGVANLLTACFSGVDDHDKVVGVCRVDEAEKLLRAFDAWLARLRGGGATKPTLSAYRAALRARGLVANYVARWTHL